MLVLLICPRMLSKEVEDRRRGAPLAGIRRITLNSIEKSRETAEGYVFLSKKAGIC